MATCVAFCFLKWEEEASSKIVWSRDQNDGKQAEHQANVRHFDLSRKRIAARMRICQCMSHFVYDLRSRPLVRDQAARVRGQIASDHCRSDLITGRTHWAGRGTPFLKLIYLSTPTENSGPKFEFRLLRSLVKLLTFQNFTRKRVNKSEMLQKFSQTQDTIFFIFSLYFQL